MAHEYVIASDLGSSGCKSVCINAQGQVVGAAQQPYPTHYQESGWAEQDPEDWYEAFCKTVRMILDTHGIQADRIAGVGIVGVTHNAVLLDERDRPLARAIIIFDTRSQVQSRQIRERWGAHVFERTLNTVSPVWTWPQLLWVKQNRPGVWKATRRVLFQKDYVRNRIAPSFVTDFIDASGSLLFDPNTEEWIGEFVSDLGLEASMLPPSRDPLSIVGAVNHSGAMDTGLTVGTPVIVGTTDTVAEMVGAGCLRRGDSVVKLASVGRIAIVNGTPVHDAQVLNYRHVLDGLWYPGTASKYAASAYHWLRESVWADARGENIYARMDAAAGEIGVGSNGLLFTPHLGGAWAPYWSDHMRGGFIGLTRRHHRSHLTRAVLEGVAFSLKDAMAAMERTGVEATDIRLIGRGADSLLWRQMMADVLDRPLKLPGQPDAAFGAALLTAAAIGLIPNDPSAVESLSGTPETVMPDEVNASRYRRYFDTYRHACEAFDAVSCELDGHDRVVAD